MVDIFLRKSVAVGLVTVAKDLNESLLCFQEGSSYLSPQLRLLGIKGQGSLRGRSGHLHPEQEQGLESGEKSLTMSTVWQ